MSHNNSNTYGSPFLAGGGGGGPHQVPLNTSSYRHPYLQHVPTSSSVAETLQAELDTIQEKLHGGLDMDEFQVLAQRETVLKQELAEELAKNVQSQAQTHLFPPHNAELTTSGTQYLAVPRGRPRSTSTSATSQLTAPQSLHRRSVSASGNEPTRLARAHSQLNDLLRQIKGEPADSSRLPLLFDQAHALQATIAQAQAGADVFGHLQSNVSSVDPVYVAQRRRSNDSLQTLPPPFEHNPSISSASTTLPVPKIDISPAGSASRYSHRPAPSKPDLLRPVHSGVNPRQRSNSDEKPKKLSAAVVLNHQLAFEQSQLIVETQEKKTIEEQVKELRKQLAGPVNEADRKLLNRVLKHAEDRLTIKGRTCRIIEQKIAGFHQAQQRLPSHSRPLPEASYLSSAPIPSHLQTFRQNQANSISTSPFIAQPDPHRLSHSQSSADAPAKPHRIAELEAQLSELGKSITFRAGNNVKSNDETKRIERKRKYAEREKTIQRCDQLLDELEKAREEYKHLTGIELPDGTSLLTSSEPSQQACVEAKPRKDDLNDELGRLEGRIRSNEDTVNKWRSQLESATTGKARLRGKVGDAEKTGERLARQERVVRYFQQRAAQGEQDARARLVRSA
ncbi:hypothetical protein JCM5350_007376 [Sporobolomyces pararoseus]